MNCRRAVSLVVGAVLPEDVQTFMARNVAGTAAVRVEALSAIEDPPGAAVSARNNDTHAWTNASLLLDSEVTEWIWKGLQVLSGMRTSTSWSVVSMCGGKNGVLEQMKEWRYKKRVEKRSRATSQAAEC